MWGGGPGSSGGGHLGVGGGGSCHQPGSKLGNCELSELFFLNSIFLVLGKNFYLSFKGET